MRRRSLLPLPPAPPTPSRPRAQHMLSFELPASAAAVPSEEQFCSVVRRGSVILRPRPSSFSVSRSVPSEEVYFSVDRRGSLLFHPRPSSLFLALHSLRRCSSASPAEAHFYLTHDHPFSLSLRTL
eukprot:847852-Pleurochrysis_carterae.AAC.1